MNTLKSIERVHTSRLRAECKHLRIDCLGLSRVDMITLLKHEGLEQIDIQYPAKPPKIDVSNRNDDLSNVFLGNGAGKYELGSNKLYISNDDSTNPLIKGEFDTGIINISHVLNLKEDKKIENKSITDIIGNEGDLRRVGSDLYMYRSTKTYPGWYPIVFGPIVVI